MDSSSFSFSSSSSPSAASEACGGGAVGPQSEADFVVLRECLSLALWQTVEATFPEVTDEGGKGNKKGGEDGSAPVVSTVTPPMLSVRLKALDQIVKLYDLGREARPAAAANAGVPGPVPYATPEVIAELVRARLRGRDGEGS